MRLWHKDLIPVLPRQQLLGQWRELCAIMRNIEAMGTPNHVLVNRIMDYQGGHLWRYAIEVKREMDKRGYKCDFDKFLRHGVEEFVGYHYEVGVRECFAGWMTDRYLRQCYYNLEEKHDCGAISDEEFKPIYDMCKRVL